MIGRVVLALLGLLEALLQMQRVLGTAFLLRFLQALEKPWTVR